MTIYFFHAHSYDFILRFLFIASNICAVHLIVQFVQGYASLCKSSSQLAFLLAFPTFPNFVGAFVYYIEPCPSIWILEQ